MSLFKFKSLIDPTIELAIDATDIHDARYRIAIDLDELDATGEWMGDAGTIAPMDRLEDLHPMIDDYELDV